MPFNELIENIYTSVKNIYLPQYAELETLITEDEKECVSNWLNSWETMNERFLRLRII